MTRTQAKIAAVGLALTLGLLAAAPPAGAATILAGPQASALNYLNPHATIGPGEPVSFTNYDLVGHDVTSVDTYKVKPKKRRGRKRGRVRRELLFRSDLIGFGQTAPVTGTERLRSGRRYSFFCSLHPSMTGSISVR